MRDEQATRRVHYRVARWRQDLSDFHETATPMRRWLPSGGTGLPRRLTAPTDHIHRDSGDRQIILGLLGEHRIRPTWTERASQCGRRWPKLLVGGAPWRRPGRSIDWTIDDLCAQLQSPEAPQNDRGTLLIFPLRIPASVDHRPRLASLVCKSLYRLRWYRGRPHLTRRSI